MEHAAWTKEDIVDVFNVGVEELIHLRYELPRFDQLLRLTYRARKKTNAVIYTTINRAIPYVKFRHFAMEAKSLNANRVGEIAQPKKAVLLAAMVKSALARTIDDIMIMIVKKVGKIHRNGKIKLDEYPEANRDNRDNTDRIVTSYMSIHENA